MICKSCYWNASGSCVEGFIPVEGYCGEHIPLESTPEETGRLLDEWAARNPEAAESYIGWVQFK